MLTQEDRKRYAFPLAVSELIIKKRMIKESLKNEKLFPVTFWLNVLSFYFASKRQKGKKEAGKVSQRCVAAHHCFKAWSILHFHFHVIISVPFHCELLQKMTSNTCSTLALMEMLAIIHYRSSYSAFYLLWLPFNDRALWGSEHMSACFRRIYWDCSKLLWKASRLVPDEWCFSLQFWKSQWLLGKKLREGFLSCRNRVAFPLSCHPAAWRADNSGQR